MPPLAPSTPERICCNVTRWLLFSLTLLACTAARAAIVIDIEGVEGELKRNVLIFLSLERYKNRNDLDDNQVERLNDRVEREVGAALRPFGYYDPVVNSDFTKTDRSRNWHVQVSILPGAAIKLRNVSLQLGGSGASDPSLRRIIDSPALKSGQQLNHARYDGLKGQLQRTAATLGYLDAKLLRSELLVDPVNHVADVSIEMHTGARYHFGATTIEQNAINDSLARRYIRYHENDPFDATQLLRTQFAMDDSQYFSTVEVLPGEPDRATLAVPVSIRAEPNRRSHYQFGAGYGTDTLIRGTASWENRLLNRNGHSFRTEVRAANQAQSFTARYQMPIGDPALEKLSLKLTAKSEKLGDLDVNSVDLEPSITQTLGTWQRVLSGTVTRTTTRDSTSKLTTRAFIPAISFSAVPQGYLGEALFTRALYAEVRGSHSALGSDSNFLQLRLQGERVLDIAPQYHLLVRGELGASLVSNFDDLPGSERFFAGGDRSVRGFGYNDLSPRNALGEKIGGRHLLTGTVEVERDLPRNFGIALFTDFGNAFNKFGDPLAYSIGVGARWRLPVVTVGIDVAQSLTKLDTGVTASGERFRSLGPRFHLNFSPKL